MPRTTRATARATQVDPEESATAPLPSTPQKIRKPLGDVTGNVVREAQHIEIDESKGKTDERVQKEVVDISSCGRTSSPYPQELEVIEDDRCSTGSSAVEAARDSLRESGSGTYHSIVQSSRLLKMLKNTRYDTRSR